MKKTKYVSTFSIEGVRFPTLLVYNTNTGHITISIPRFYKRVQASSNKKWREANPEQSKESSRKWHHANPEKVKAKRKRRAATHRERESVRKMIWAHANHEKVKAQNKVWRDENRDKVREYQRERRTYLCAYTDCIKLNTAFIGCEFHHLTPDTGVHVPASLHRSISHSLNHDRNMQEINRAAMDWLHGIRRESPQTTLEAFG